MTPLFNTYFKNKMICFKVIQILGITNINKDDKNGELADIESEKDNNFYARSFLILHKFDKSDKLYLYIPNNLDNDIDNDLFKL